MIRGNIAENKDGAESTGSVLSTDISVSTVPTSGVEQRWIKPAKYVLALVVTVAAFAHNVFRYRVFEYPIPIDLGLFNQVVYNVAYHHSFVETLYSRETFLASHFIPLIAVLSPLYWLVSSPIILIAVGAIAVGGAGLVIARIAEEVLQCRVCGVLMLAIYFAHPAVINLFSMGFRMTIVAMFFVALVLLYYVRSQYAPFLVFLFLALLCKETIALALTPIGLLALVHRRSIRWIAVPTIIGAVYFFGTGGFVMPLLSEQGGFAGVGFDEFAYLGSTPVEIAWSLISEPTDTWSILTERSRLAFYGALLIPLGFLPLLGLEYLLVPIGTIMLVTLPVPEYFRSITYWYAAPLVPFLFAAAAVGVRRLRPWLGSMLRRSGTAVVTGGDNGQSRLSALILMIILVLTLSSLRPSSIPNVSLAPFAQGLRPVATDFHRALDRIPSSASVSAQYPFYAYVSARSQVYLFPSESDSVDYIILNPTKDIFPLRGQHENYVARVVDLLTSGTYGVVTRVDGNLLLQRGFDAELNAAIVDELTVETPLKRDLQR